MAVRQSPRLVEKRLHNSINNEGLVVPKKKKKLDFKYTISVEQKTVELHCQDHYDNVSSRRILSKGVTFIELFSKEADDGNEDHGPVYHRRIVIDPAGFARLECMGKEVKTVIVFTKRKMFHLVLDNIV